MILITSHVKCQLSYNNIGTSTMYPLGLKGKDRVILQVVQDVLLAHLWPTWGSWAQIPIKCWICNLKKKKMWAPSSTHLKLGTKNIPEIKGS